MYHAITFLVFVAALAAYFAGSQAGAVGLLVAGVAIECYAWYRVLHRDKPDRDPMA
ncbi:MAG: glycosyl transferase family 39 [Pseudomonadota bacterium]|nr:MAG: glycosyl transferase family 39 [Pseudomonadota bacterium]